MDIFTPNFIIACVNDFLAIGAMAYADKVASSKMQLDRKYMELLFKAIVLEEENKILKNKKG